MNVKKLSIISLTLLTISFMGILMCVGLLFGEDSGGSNSSGASPGGSNVSEEVLKHRAMVEKYAKELNISEYVLILLAIIQVESGGRCYAEFGVSRVATEFIKYRGIHQTRMSLFCVFG